MRFVYIFICSDPLSLTLSRLERAKILPLRYLQIRNLEEYIESSMEAIKYFDDEETQEYGIPPVDVETYSEDGRLSLDDLYTSYLRLADEHGWQMDTMFRQRDDIGEGGLILPVFSFCTSKEGPALWILAGIHGEEPAGPNAIAEELDRIGVLGKHLPMVVIPLCNPKGYRRNWRFQHTPKREYKSAKHPDGGVSVSDADHALLALDGSPRPRLGHPACPECDLLTRYILKRSMTHPPVLFLDFHEDEDDACSAPYIFSNGPLNTDDLVAKEVVKILRDSGMSMWREGATRFGERIIGGIAAGTYDGSIDEFLAAKEVWNNGAVVAGPGAKSAVVIETPVVGIPLEKRIAAHRAVLQKLPELWWIAQ